MTSRLSFSYQNDLLHCDQVPLNRIGQAVGTPCYVYSRRLIAGNFRTFNQTFSPLNALTCYAVKANPNLAVLQLLASLGAGFDVVSGGELRRLSRIGADFSRVMFSGVGKSAAELQLASESKLLAVNVESSQELQRLIELARSSRRQVPVSLRLNPGVDVKTHPYVSTGRREHKFGIDPAQVPYLLEIIGSAGDSIRVMAVGCHIGSQILEVDPFIRAFHGLKAVADQLRAEKLCIERLNVGGGFGIPYRGEQPAPLQDYAGFLQQHRGDYQIVLEPGRFIVGNAGLLLTRVLYRKCTQDKNFVVVDAAMNDFLRPALYQAYHEVLPGRQAETSIRADIVGPICETGDFLAQNRDLPDLQPGDLLAVMDAGAYGFGLASNYNSRPRPAEVMVDGDRFQVVRDRETFEEMVAGERVFRA